MADHWKSIANLVGAPGVDETLGDEENAQDQPAAAALPADVPLPANGPPAKDIPVESNSETETEPKSHTTSETEALVPDAQPPKPTAPAKKRKSSWESLARMFNIPIERAEVEDVIAESAPIKEEPKAPAPPKPAPRSAPVAPKPAELSLFKSDEESSGANPALKEMFGESSKIPAEGWGTKRRVVDDVGWGDEDVEAKTPDTEAESDSGDSEEAGDVRRGRRRRRRGRRGGPSDAARDSDLSSPSTDSLEDDAWGTADLEDPVESSIEWDEPETFETDIAENGPESTERRSSRRRKRGRSRSTEESQQGRSSERAAEPVLRDEPVEGRRRESSSSDRRPSRGRDRGARDGGERDSAGRDGGGRSSGRGRGRSSEGRAPSDGRSSEGRVAESRSSEPRTDETRSRSRSLEDEADGGERAGRRRRRRGSEPRREPPVLEAGIEDPELEIADEDSVDEVTRHRNIPTWQDSLESIIAANTENHKRNDNRGGGPRGRSRGRR